MGYVGQAPAAAAVTSTDILDGTVASADLADDAVTLAKIADDAIGVAQLSATGTASSGTYLRGDNSWAATAAAYTDSDAISAVEGEATLVLAGDVSVAADKAISLLNEGKVKFTDTTFADGNQRSSGITLRFTTSSLAIAIGQAVHLSGTGVILADASTVSQGAMPCIGVAASATTGTGTENIDVLVLGCMRYDTYDFTVGSDVFVTTTPGGLVSIEPTAAPVYVQRVGVAISPDILYVNPSIDTTFSDITTYITATGGTVTTDGDYKVHKFTGSGTFAVSQQGYAEVLVIAGGGSGGGGYNAGGGGGGAGGLGYSSQVAMYTGNTTVTVGAGGASPALNQLGFTGSNSVLGTIGTLYGGGGGGNGSSAGVSGRDGGSGGGGAPNNGTGGASTKGSSTALTMFGNAGGTAAGYWGSGSGAGGVSGGVGGTNAVGGAGKDYDIVLAGTDVSYAGGGGSGNSSGGKSGSAGGGSGYSSGSGGGSGGSANTGSGGGGGGNTNAGNSVYGGSGIVIIRYRFQ